MSIEKALYQFGQTVHQYAQGPWGSAALKKQFYAENNELRDKAQVELTILRKMQKELQWYRTRYPGPKNPELQAGDI